MPKMPVVRVYPRPHKVHCPLCSAYQRVGAKMPATITCKKCAKRFRMVNGWTNKPMPSVAPDPIGQEPSRMNPPGVADPPRPD